MIRRTSWLNQAWVSELTAWVWVPGLSLSGCVTLDKLVNVLVFSWKMAVEIIEAASYDKSVKMESFAQY